MLAAMSIRIPLAFATSLALLPLVGLTTPASAQTPTAFVAMRNLTVEGRDAPADMRAALDSNTTGVMHGFDVCYAARQAVIPALAGTIQLRLWVSSLEVIRVSLDAGTTLDEELFACVKARLLEFRLPPDSPRAGVTVRFVLAFTAPQPGMVVACTASSCAPTACGSLGAPCCPNQACAAGVCLSAVCQVPPPPPAPPVTVVVTRSRGARNIEQLAAVVPASTFEHCVDSSTSFSGDLPLTVSITAAGRVRATASRGTLRDTRAIACVRTALNALRVERQRRSTSARIVVTVGVR